MCEAAAYILPIGLTATGAVLTAFQVEAHQRVDDVDDNPTTRHTKDAVVNTLSGIMLGMAAPALFGSLLWGCRQSRGKRMDPKSVETTGQSILQFVNEPRKPVFRESAVEFADRGRRTSGLGPYASTYTVTADESRAEVRYAAYQSYKRGMAVFWTLLLVIGTLVFVALSIMNAVALDDSNSSLELTNDAFPALAITGIVLYAFGWVAFGVALGEKSRYLANVAEGEPVATVVVTSQA